MHERVHEQDRESRGNVRIEYGLPLRSLRVGLVGKADVVEFHRLDKESWQPFPVEYKRGKPKSDDCDLIQLCAQCLCLEEMLGVNIPEGAIFYGRTRRRLAVIFDAELRAKTEETVRLAHAFINAGITPKPEYVKKCETCSLSGICMPRSMEHGLSIEKYFKEALKEE